MSFHDDTRGASIPVTHALTIAITALLMVGLLLGAGQFLEGQQQTVARQQLSNVGGDIVDQINTLDDLNASGETVTATLEPTYPRTIAGKPYTLALVTDGPRSGTLHLNSTVLSRSIRLPVRTDTPLRQSKARGEEPTLRLCDTDEITLGGCP